MREALDKAGDVIIGIYLLDEAESWMMHITQDIVWKYGKKYPGLAFEIEKEFKEKYGYGKFGVPSPKDKDPFKRLALNRFVSDKLFELQKDICEAAKKINPELLFCANDDTHGFCGLSASNYKGIFDIVPHQLNNFPSAPGKCEAELKYLVDVSGCEVWPFPHIEAWADAEETNEALSEIARVGCAGIMPYNVAGFKYSTHDCWNAPERWKLENSLADMFAEGYRVQLPKKSEIALLMSIDSRRAYNRSLCGSAHNLIGPGTGAWYTFIDEDIIEKNPRILEKYKIVIIPYADIIRKGVLKSLIKAAEKGVTLFIQSDCFKYDLDGTHLDCLKNKLLEMVKVVKRKKISGNEYFTDLLNNKKLKPSSQTGLPLTIYKAHGKIKPLIYDKNSNIIAFSASLGRGEVVWIGYNPFNYRDSEDSGWRTFFRNFFNGKKIKTKQNIWSFKLKDLPISLPELEGICLTGNSCTWQYNRPRMMRNFPLPVAYTYSHFPNTIHDYKKSGWLSTAKGKITDRIKRFDEVMPCGIPSSETMKSWGVSWRGVDTTDIVFDLKQEWELDSMKILFGNKIPEVMISGSEDGVSYILLSKKISRSIADGSNMCKFDLANAKNKFRFVKITLSGMPKEAATEISEVEVWSK